MSPYKPRPASPRKPGHALRESATAWSCQCGLAGPWAKADYSLAEVRSLHRRHKERQP